MSGPTGADRPSQAVLRSARALSSRKGRRETGAFVADGAQAVREALAADAVEQFFSVADSAHANEFLGDVAQRGIPRYVLTEREMAQLTDTVTPQGVAARVATTAVETPWSRATIPPEARLVVVCAQIRDPGNAGTVIRCADAFGADAVVLSEGSVEVTNPKVVRASVGSVFHLPILTGAPLAEAVAALRADGFQILAADGGGELLPDVDLTGKTAWVMGNEAWGLPPEDRALADRVVGIPMWGRAESLNLATAAAVCLFTTASAQRA